MDVMAIMGALEDGDLMLRTGKQEKGRILGF